jgi:hypothetical protein
VRKRRSSFGKAFLQSLDGFGQYEIADALCHTQPQNADGVGLFLGHGHQVLNSPQNRQSVLIDAKTQGGRRRGTLRTVEKRSAQSLL